MTRNVRHPAGRHRRKMCGWFREILWAHAQIGGASPRTPGGENLDGGVAVESCRERDAPPHAAESPATPGLCVGRRWQPTRQPPRPERRRRRAGQGILAFLASRRPSKLPAVNTARNPPASDRPVLTRDQASREHSAWRGLAALRLRAGGVARSAACATLGRAEAGEPPRDIEETVMHTGVPAQRHRSPTKIHGSGPDIVARAAKIPGAAISDRKAGDFPPGSSSSNSDAERVACFNSLNIRKPPPSPRRAASSNVIVENWTHEHLVARCFRPCCRRPFGAWLLFLFPSPDMG